MYLRNELMVHSIVGEHWCVFDTTVDAPGRKRNGIVYRFPEMSREKEMRKLFAEHISTIEILRTIVFIHTHIQN